MLKDIPKNTLAASVFNTRLAQANLITKTDFDAKLSSLNRKITSNKSKHLLVENELKKLKVFDSSYFIGKSHFEEDVMQNYLVFQPICRYFKQIAGVGNGSHIYYWQSKGLSDGRISSITTSNYSVIRKLSCYVTKTRVEFFGGCLRQEKVTFNHGKVVNIYLVCEIIILANVSKYKYSSIDNYPTLKNALFGAVSLTKHADIDKCKYSGYGIGFDRRTSFSHPSGGDGQNVIIFGVDMSSSAKIDNRKKDILIRGKGPLQGLEHTLTAEKMYSINFSKDQTKFWLSLHYNGANSYLFVNGKEIHKFKAKDSEIVATPLCVGNISKDWSIDNMKKTGFNGYVYDFSVDCSAIAVDILDIYNYLMKKNDIA